MKRKLASIIAILLFAVGILLISVDRSTCHIRQSFAVSSLKFEVLPEESATPTAIVQEKIEYYLVYPGILPDHPLYKIKMIRDRILLWFSSDLAVKTERQLLYADKRMGAGKVLIEGNKVTLGLTTLWKAEKYLDQATETLLQAKEKGLEISNLSAKIKTASLKHEEILLDLKEGLSGEGQTAINEIEKYLQEIKSKIDRI